MSRRVKLIVAIAAVAATATIVVVTRAGGSAPPPYASYAVKFTCGEFGKTLLASSPDVPEGPVKPGDYQTSINIHNPQAGIQVSFVKKAVLLYSGTQPVTALTLEGQKAPGGVFSAFLPPDYGMLIDCQDIRKKLLPTVPAAPTFIEGYVIIQVPPSAATTSPPPLDVTALYTAHGYNCVPTAAGACNASTITREGFTEHVQVIQPTFVTH